MIGAFFIVTANNLALSGQEARAEFGKQYYAWFGKLFDNSKTLVGNVVGLDWLPDK